MDVNISAIEDSEESEEYSRENIYHLREYLNCHKQTANTIVDIKGTVGYGSEGNEEHVIENWRKGNPCYIVAESLGESYPASMWKVELVND